MQHHVRSMFARAWMLWIAKLPCSPEAALYSRPPQFPLLSHVDVVPLPHKTHPHVMHSGLAPANVGFLRNVTSHIDMHRARQSSVSTYGGIEVRRIFT